MPEVNVSIDGKFEHIKSIAIAIAGERVTHNIDQRHIGILFRADDAAPKLIHLAWHGRFLLECPSIDYCWIPLPGFDEQVLESMADWLSTVWHVNGNDIPYSIKPYDCDPFDASGKIKRDIPGEGFTCATFVMWAFYHFAAIDLIDKDTWKDRPEDTKWREHILEMLRRHSNANEEHIAAQLPFVESAARFRPEEVAGVAGEYCGTSIEFEEAIEFGNQVLNSMSRLGKYTNMCL